MTEGSVSTTDETEAERRAREALTGCKLDHHAGLHVSALLALVAELRGELAWKRADEAAAVAKWEAVEAEVEVRARAQSPGPAQGEKGES